jgi:hypothetical protein
MVAKNDVTGDTLRSRVSSEKYSDGWDRIFSKKKTTWFHKCKHEGDMEVGIGQACNWCGEKEDGTSD